MKHKGHRKQAKDYTHSSKKFLEKLLSRARAYKHKNSVTWVYAHKRTQKSDIHECTNMYAVQNCLLYRILYSDSKESYQL